MFGHNSRETFQDATYDVQTQEVTHPARWIETHVYRNGKIVATVRSDFPEDAPASSLQERMSRQHEEICGKVREGSYELVFLWISRGVIALESLDYVQALECFGSVLAIEETHGEANTYLNRIRAALQKDGRSRRKVLQEYWKQILALEQSGRTMEAGRKRSILNRIYKAPPRSGRVHGTRRAQGSALTSLTFLENVYEKIMGIVPPGTADALLIVTKKLLSKTTGTLLPWIKGTLLPWITGTLLPWITGTLLPWITGTLLPKIAERLPSRIREDLLPRMRKQWIPRIRENLLPTLRENLFSKYLLVTCSAVVLLILSGLISADFQIKLDPAYHASLGKDYLEGNRLAPARNLFYGVLRQDPFCQEALAGFWETLRREDNFEKAGEMLRALVEDQQSSPQICFHLAEAYRLSSRCADALPFYQRAAEQGYPEVPCKLGMGLCLIDQQNPTAAINLWEGLVQRGLEDYRIDYCLGSAYELSGRLGRASMHFTRALHQRPQSSLIYRALGQCLQGLHQEDKAQRLLEMAANLESEGGGEPRCPGHPAPEGDSRQVPVDRFSLCFPFPLIEGLAKN